MSPRDYFSQRHLNRDPFPAGQVDDIVFFTPELKQKVQEIRHLLDQGRRLILITASGGGGKTALCRYLAMHEQTDRFVYAIHTAQGLNADGLLTGLPGNGKPDGCLAGCRRQGREPVILIDDAELLPEAMLEYLLELAGKSDGTGRFRIILSGRDELGNRLAGTAAQGAFHQIKLSPFTAAQTVAYLDHRLSGSGAAGVVLDDRQKQDIFVVAGGIPGRINRLARQALQDPADRRPEWPGSGPGHWRWKWIGPGRIAVAGGALGLVAGLILIAIHLSPFRAIESGNAAFDVLEEPAVAGESVIPAGRVGDPVIQETHPAAAERPATIATAKQDSGVVNDENPPSFPGLLGRDWLSAQKQDEYVLQLIGANEAETIRKFLAYQPPLTGPLALYLTHKGDSRWYVLVTGTYPSREAARAAINELPPYARATKPWPRLIETVVLELAAPELEPRE